MNDREEEPLTSRATEARDALRSAKQPAAEPAFRAQLKREFVTGMIEERELRPTGIGRGDRPPRPRFGSPGFWAGLATAAAVAVVGLGVLNRGPAWELASVAGGGTAQIDGIPVSLEDQEQLRRRLRPGVRIMLPADGEIGLRGGKELVLLLAPGTEMTLPPPLPRWFGRSSRMEMRAGETRISTGARFRGARFGIRTPFAGVEITGTTVAVIQDSTFTCVCVLDGVASMAEAGGRMTQVPAGMRRFQYRDHSPSRVEPIDDMQRMKLTMFRDASSRLILETEP